MHRFNYFPSREMIGLKGTNNTSNVCRTGAFGITLPSVELQLKGVLFYEGCTVLTLWRRLCSTLSLQRAKKRQNDHLSDSREGICTGERNWERDTDR